jgi:hypothetical protein
MPIILGVGSVGSDHRAPSWIDRLNYDRLCHDKTGASAHDVSYHNALGHAVSF